MSRYLVVIEKTGTGYSAYSPDLPGCVAASKARDSVEREMHQAIEFHLDGLRRAGKPTPAPLSQASYCKVSACFQSVAVVVARSVVSLALHCLLSVPAVAGECFRSW